YGKARGMTIEDVNRALNYTPLGGYYMDSEGMHTTGNLTTKLKDLPIWNYIKQTGTYTPDGTNTEKALGNYELNGYYYNLNAEGTELTSEFNEITSPVTTTEKNTVFGTSANYEYWLASNCLFAYGAEDGGTCLFMPHCILNNRVGGVVPIFQSNDGSELNGVIDLYFRPVVSLRSNLPALSK
ncbi:MAG: hypothetical protein ACI4U9_04405, partial [Clostridia bacterium]